MMLMTEIVHDYHIAIAIPDITHYKPTQSEWFITKHLSQEYTHTHTQAGRRHTLVFK